MKRYVGNTLAALILCTSGIRASPIGLLPSLDGSQVAVFEEPAGGGFDAFDAGCTAEEQDCAGIENEARGARFSLPVPEPATMSMIGLALIVAPLAARRRFRKPVP